MPVGLFCKSYSHEASDIERHVINPYGDFKSFASWDESLRQAGVLSEGRPMETRNHLNGDGELELLYDLAQIHQNDLWKRYKARFCSKADRMSKYNAQNPRLSEWMREDLSTGIFFASLRDVICE